MTDSEKREKVIRGLEICTKPGSCSERCPYYHIEITEGSCDYFLLTDALALLKEQEPKMVIQTTSTIRCPGCDKQITNKGAIHKEIKYCWKCGQAVKWND